MIANQESASGVGWRSALAIAAVFAVVAATVAWLSMAPSGIAKDFTLPWTAANHVLAGRDPYDAMRPTGVYPFNVPFYYPLPAALLAIPFAPFPVTIAGVAFVGLTFGVAGLLLARYDVGRLPVLLGFPALMCAVLGQWSPLFVAATVVPALQVVLPVKPTLGAAVFVARPTRVGLAMALGIVAVAFLVQPGWLVSWRAAVASAWTTYTPPVRWAGGLGMLLLGVLVWWRDAGARMLAVMALAPQLPLFYDQLLVGAVARTQREAWLLAGASWIGGLAWAFQGSSPAGETPARSLILATIYGPALGVVAWRHLRAGRRPASPPAPSQ